MSSEVSWDELSKKLSSKSDNVLIEALTEIRVLTTTVNRHNTEVVKAGLIPSIVKLLRKSKNTKVRVESVWILINIAYGNKECVSSIINAGALPVLVRMLNCEIYELKHNSAWAIANLCGDSLETRDKLLNEGLIGIIVEILESSNQKIEFLRIIVWICLNISRHRPFPTDKGAESLLTPIMAVLVRENDKKVVVDICWFFQNVIVSYSTISHLKVYEILVHFRQILNRKELYAIEASLCFVRTLSKARVSIVRYQIFRSEILKKIAQLAMHPTPSINHLCVQIFRILACFGSHRYEENQFILHSNILSSLSRIFTDTTVKIHTKKEGIHFLKWMTQRTMHYEQLQLIFSVENVVLWRGFFELLKSKNEIMVMEVTRSIKYIADELNVSWVRERMVEYGVVEAFLDQLDHVDEEIHEMTYFILQFFDPSTVPHRRSIYFIPRIDEEE